MTNKQRILTISKNLGLSHIGSNVSCLSVLEYIYKEKRTRDIVILDNAHAHLAHLVVSTIPTYQNTIPHEGFIDRDKTRIIEDSIKKHGIHCDRKAACDSSGGSLGHGIGIGIGYALADKSRTVYVTVSDGSMMEGSNWEALRIANDLRLTNLFVYGNFNGYTAVAKRNATELYVRMAQYAPHVQKKAFFTYNGTGFDGVNGHYKTL